MNERVLRTAIERERMSTELRKVNVQAECANPLVDAESLVYIGERELISRCAQT